MRKSCLVFATALAVIISVPVHPQSTQSAQSPATTEDISRLNKKIDQNKKKADQSLGALKNEQEAVQRKIDKTDQTVDADREQVASGLSNIDRNGAIRAEKMNKAFYLVGGLVTTLLALLIGAVAVLLKRSKKDKDVTVIMTVASEAIAKPIEVADMTVLASSDGRPANVLVEPIEHAIPSLVEKFFADPHNIDRDTVTVFVDFPDHSRAVRGIAHRPTKGVPLLEFKLEDSYPGKKEEVPMILPWHAAKRRMANVLLGLNGFQSVHDERSPRGLKN